MKECKCACEISMILSERLDGMGQLEGCVWVSRFCVCV